MNMSRSKVDVLESNADAAVILEDLLKSSFGPTGLCKMMITEENYFITNDVVIMLERIQMKHPIARMLGDMVRTQRDVFGGGTKTALILTLKLLQEARRLRRNGLHQTTICKGYRIARNEIINQFEKISIDLPLNEETLRMIAQTALWNNTVFDKEKIINNIIEVAKAQNYDLDLSEIIIKRQLGFGTPDCEFVNGVVFKKETDTQILANQIKNARILVFNKALDIDRGERPIVTTMDIEPNQLKAAIFKEQEYMKNIVDRITSSGANVVFCEKAIDDFIIGKLSRKGIFAVRRVSKSDLSLIAKASGAQIISDIGDVKEANMGFAESVEELKIGEELFIYLKGCKNQRVSTITIRGKPQSFNEGERLVKNGLSAVKAALEDRRFCIGGGATEAELAKRLREFALNFNDKTQLVIEGFANTLESIPYILAENAGLDPIDFLMILREEHTNEKLTYGINVITGKVEDLLKRGVLEPVRIKRGAINIATEMALTLIRIDACLASIRNVPEPDDTGFNLLENKPAKRRKWKQSPVLVPR